MSITLEQQRARHAYRVVDEVTRKSQDVQKQFKVQVRKFPARIVSSGLGQALAFLEAKGYAEALTLGLSDWFKSGPVAFQSGHQSDKLLMRLIHGDSDFLRFATAEALAYAQWVLRFTDASIKVDATEED